jgi:hypothetical protein
MPAEIIGRCGRPTSMSIENGTMPPVQSRADPEMSPIVPPYFAF